MDKEQFEWSVFTQAIGDAMGYPKSEDNQRQVGYSMLELRELYDNLVASPKKELAEKEKQIILNCISGALEYVGTDIPSLYGINKEQLQRFRQDLEERWGIQSTYFNP